MEKSDCINSIIRKANRTIPWRASIEKKWPDARNFTAACTLRKIVDEARDLSDADWQRLRPYFVDDSFESAWNIALTAACRNVGYKGHVTDIESFVRHLIRLLRDPQTFAMAA